MKNVPNEKFDRRLQEMSAGASISYTNKNKTVAELDGKMKQLRPKMMRPGNFGKRLI